MSREFPDFIDPWRAADGGRRIGGTIPLARLKRLRPLLASDEGEASFDMQFGFDQQRRATVKLEVSAPLKLICQRTLEPYVEPVTQRSVLQIIGDPAEQALLSAEEEFVLVEDGPLSVANLIEDELLLAVPAVPRSPDSGRVWQSTAAENEQGTAVSGERGDDASRQHPFELLAELLKNR